MADRLIVEFIDSAQVPDDYPGRDRFGARAVRLRNEDSTRVLYYTEGEWAAFLDGVKAGEFDDLLGGSDAAE